MPDLIARAYAHRNASEYLLVKGSRDYIVNSEGVQDIVDSPVEESMEAIGGTGDTLTGIVAALCAAGRSVKEGWPGSTGESIGRIICAPNPCNPGDRNN